MVTILDTAINIPYEVTKISIEYVPPYLKYLPELNFGYHIPKLECGISQRDSLSRRLFMVPTLPNSFLAFPRPLKRKKAEVMGKSCSHLSPLPNSMALEPIALSTAIALISSCLPFVSPSNFCYPAIFNFGDSNSDTGGLVAGIAFPVGPPNGQTYFLKPSGRLCDGRLTIDFLSNVFLSF